MRELVWRGLEDLGRARLATATAGLAALAAALTVEVALRSGASAGGAAELVGVVLVGLTLSSLLGSCARALALTAYSQPGRAWLAAGFTRVPALVTVSAVELTVQGSLMLGAALLLPRAAVTHSPLAKALLCALLCAPSLLLCASFFGAARVALVLVARGMTPSRALIHGLDVVARRLPSLLKLAGALALYTLPLTLLAAALMVASLRQVATPTASLARATALMLFELTALWSYAALANLVGRDARLTTG